MIIGLCSVAFSCSDEYCMSDVCLCYGCLFLVMMHTIVLVALLLLLCCVVVVMMHVLVFMACCCSGVCSCYEAC